MSPHLKYKINKIVNFYFVEINLFDRVKLFLNHLKHSFKLFNRKTIERKQQQVKGTFVISLPFREDRRKYISEQLNNFGLEFQFIDGEIFDGYSPFYSLFEHNTIKNLTDGALGCAAAHIKTLQIIKNKPDGLYIVFEDDVLLMNNFISDIALISNNFPLDSDIFYLGTWNQRKRDIDFLIDNSIYRSFNPRKGMYAYMITPDSAKKILSLITPFKLFYGGIDTKMGILVRKRKITAYQNIPVLVKVNFNLSSNIYNPSDKNKILHPTTKTI